MKEVINKLPISIEAGKTLEIDLKSDFNIINSMFTLIPTNAKGDVKFKITNAKSNSIEITALVTTGITPPLAYKPYKGLFDSTKEEYYVLEITPENDLEGFFSWAKDCNRELISTHAR